MENLPLIDKVSITEQTQLKLDIFYKFVFRDGFKILTLSA